MNKKLGVGLGQKLTAGLLAVLVLSSLSPADVLAGDLSNTAPTNVATNGGVIKMGNSTVIIRPGDMITDAQQTALNQVLAGGKQQLLLNMMGAATGGRFDVMGATGSLIIPRGVMALQNISSTGALNLTGNLANSGSYYLYSTSNAINQANITAANILNSTGAMLSTVLPSAIMTQYSAIKSVDLNLNAIENIINQGTISSSGNLSLTAGKSIENSGVLQSAKNFDLVANNIQNSGLISALSGNININPGNSNHITINNTNGTIEALLGNINVREAGFSDKANFILHGGDVFANALNINSGTGIVNVNVNKLTPVVNIDGGEIHVTASTSQLTLGKLNAVGDPTIYNLNGDVLLTDDITTKGAPLAIVAKGNIRAYKTLPAQQTSTSANSLVIIDTSVPVDASNPNGGAGGSILMIAGAKFTVTPPPTDPSLQYTSATDILIVSGGSFTGGKIELNFPARSHQFGSSIITDFQQGKMITSGTGAGFAAGDVTLVAYKGAVKDSGTINLPYDQVNITANGGTGAHNGNIRMIAGGGQTIRAILMGTITANGAGTTGGGNVELYAATPKIVSGDGTIRIENGAVLNGGTFMPDKFTASEILMNSQAITNPSTNIFGTFTAKTGGTAIFGNIVAGGDVDIQSGGVGGIVVNDITTSGDVNLKTYGGNAAIGLNGIIKADGDVNIEANGTGGIFGLNRQINNRLFMTPGTITVGNSLYSPNATFFMGATVNASGTRIYQPDYYKNQLYVIDAATGTAVATLNIPDGPQGTALSPDGTRLYVVTAGDSNTAPQIVAIDTASNTIIAGESFTLGTNGIDKAQTVAITPDGNYAYVVMAGLTTTAGTPQKVVRVDLSNGATTVVGGMTGSLGQDQTGGIIINPQGTTAWVTAAGDKKVYIIDLTSSTPTAVGSIDLSYFKSVATELRPFTLTMDPTGTRVYVGIAGQLRVDVDHDGHIDQQFIRDGYIVVIDSTASSTTYSKILANVKMPTAAGGQLAGGTFPQGLSVNPTGTQLLVQGTYLPYVFGMYTAPNQVLENILVTPNSGPDGFGSTSFSSLTHVNGVPVIRTYSSNTQGLVETTSGFIPNTISQIQQGTVYGTNVNLKSGGGNIILNYALKPGQNGTMTVNTGGTGAVLLSNLSDDAMTNVGASSAPSNFFEIGSIHGLNITGDINSPRILLHTSSQTNSDIVLGGNIGQTGSIIDIKAAGAGDITQLAGKSIIGSSLNLFSGTGTIGTAGQALKTTVSVLSAITNGTDVNIDNTGAALTLTGSASGGLFNLVNSGAITVAAGGGITSPNVNLTAGLNKGIAVNAGIGNVNTPGTINLTANGTAGITMGKGTFVIAGNTANLATGKGSFGTAAAPIRLTADALNATTAGSGYFTDTENVDVSTDIAGTTVIDGKSGVNVGSGGIQSSKSITINGGNGAINIQGNIGGAATTTVVLSTSNVSGSDIIQADGTLINAKTLTVKTTGGDVGASTEPLTTNASTVTITAGNGDVFLSGEGPSTGTTPYVLTLKASSGQNFNVTVDGKLVVGGALNAINVALNTVNMNTGTAEQNAGSRDIVLGGNIGTSLTGATTITATNSGFGVAGSTSNILKTTGTILSPDVTLTIPGATDVGSIGTSAKPITIKGGDLSAKAMNAGGSVFIASTGDVDLESAQAGGIFKLTATVGTNIGDSGKITVANPITVGTVGELVLQTLRNGSIAIDNDIETSGNMTFNANGTGNIAGSGVLNANGNTINLISGRGQIGFIDFGDVPVAPDAPLHIVSGTVNSKTGGNAIALNFDSAAVLGSTLASTTNGVIHVTSNTGVDILLGGPVTGFSVELGSQVPATTRSILNASANDPKAIITAKEITLVAVNQIGNNSDPIKTKSNGTLQVAAGIGALVQNTGNVKLLDSGASVGFLLTNVGNLILAGDVQAGGIATLATTGGSITTTGSQNVITADNVVLASTDLKDPLKTTSGSFGTATQKLQVDTGNLTVSTKGKAYINNQAVVYTDPLSLQGATTIGQLYLSSEGAVETSGEVGQNTSIISINAKGSINTTGLAGLFIGKAVTLISENGGVGDFMTLDSTNVKTGNLTVGAGDGQSIYVDATGNNTALNLVQSTANGTPDSLVVSARDGLTGLNYNGGISAISNVLLGTVTGSITNGSKGFIASNNVVLSAGKDIGTASAPILLKDATSSATNIGLTATAVGGSVNVRNSGTNGLTLKDFPFLVTFTNSSAKAFTVKDSSGSLTVEDAITVGLPGDVAAKKTTNNLTLIETAATGTPSININGNLDVKGGGIVIQNMNTIGTIAFGTGVTVDTLVDKTTPVTAGNITIAIGALPNTGVDVPSSPPDLTVTTDAQGKGNVTATNLDALAATGASLNALGRNIRFGGGGTGSINLNDAVITADPPGYATVSGDSGSASSSGNTLTLVAMGLGSGAFTPPPAPAGSTKGTLSVSSSGISTPPTNIISPTNTSGAGGITTAGTISISGNSTTPFYATTPPAVSIGGISGSAGGAITLTTKSAGTSPYHPIAFVSGAASAFASRQPEGMSILAPTSDTSIETPMGTLKIKAGAVVLAVIQSSGTVSVYNLHDNGAGDVTLEAAGESATVVPGSHITVTPGSVREFGDVNTIECISHRDVRTANKETATLFTSDFSVTSALKELPTLVEMRKSNDPAARRVAADIIKTAAILMQLGSSRGAYQRVTPKTRLTAMQ